MGDLSWNPSSWTVSNFAEAGVEALTGSEAAGDIAGMIGAYATGDVMGMADQGADVFDNVKAGVGALVSGVRQGIEDGVAEFNNPGSVGKPDQKKCGGGYAAGGAGEMPNVWQSEEDKELESIMKGGGSIEDKIFRLMMKLQKDKRGEVEGKFKEYQAASKDGEGGAEGAGGAGGKDKSEVLQEMQKAAGELSQLVSLTTNMMGSFKQMKDAVIQNIR